MLGNYLNNLLSCTNNLLIIYYFIYLIDGIVQFLARSNIFLDIFYNHYITVKHFRFKQSLPCNLYYIIRLHASQNYFPRTEYLQL